MGVESNDVVRMLGSYPDADALVETPPVSSTLPETERPKQSYPSKKPTTLFATLPLALGDAGHGTDPFNLSVMITPVKLVIVGMKPSAKTWYRKMRNDLGGQLGAVTGCSAWLKSGEIEAGSDPVLAYSWGSHVRLLRIKTVTVQSEEQGGKAEEVLNFTELHKFDTANAVLALEWYNPHVSVARSASCCRD
jgi:hypothetical protein